MQFWYIISKFIFVAFLPFFFILFIAFIYGSDFYFLAVLKYSLNLTLIIFWLLICVQTWKQLSTDRWYSKYVCLRNKGLMWAYVAWLHLVNHIFGGHDWMSQTKDYITLEFAASPLTRSIDRLAHNQNNVFEWSDIPTWTFLQWASNI